MYDDKRELTRSVIEERKKRTAREEIKDAVKIVKQLACGVIYEDAQGNEVYHKFRYKVGEVVAVAQNYEQTGLFDVYRAPEGTPGWTNKMFVKASIMPHQIQITDIKVQRLQDISDEDCLLEGVIPNQIGYYLKGVKSIKDNEAYTVKDGIAYKLFPLPKRAFAYLINAISGKGTWERNSYHVIYYFKLIK